MMAALLSAFAALATSRAHRLRDRFGKSVGGTCGSGQVAEGATAQWQEIARQ